MQVFDRQRKNGSVRVRLVLSRHDVKICGQNIGFEAPGFASQ